MDIYDILQIKPSTFSDFSLLANRVADYQTEKIINRNIGKLQKIREQMLVGEGIKIDQFSIKTIIQKVRKYADKQDYDITHWSIRELRIISYYFIELSDIPSHYRYALKLLKDNWKNLYFNGIVFYLLSAWNNIDKDYRRLAIDLLKEKLLAYNDRNQRYNLLKDHINLLEEHGPERMCKLILLQQKGITESPKILGFKSSTINQSYYSDVILGYIKNKNITDLDVIEEIFDLHTLERTKKLTLCYLVEECDRNGDGFKQGTLCKFINRILGDITLNTTWAPFLGASYEEALRLKHAMELVNTWFKQQFIETFFQVCVQDKERERFWLAYVNEIKDFKIVGSLAIRRLLNSNARIGSVLRKYFIETNSHVAQTCALVLFLKNKVMVEFSDTGALYAYNKNHEKVKLITRKYSHIDSINDLKTPSINLLVEPNDWGYYDYKEEGRMTHRGDWTTRLNKWMSRMVINHVDAYQLFEEANKEDEVFVANPIIKDKSQSISQFDHHTQTTTLDKEASNPEGKLEEQPEETKKQENHSINKPDSDSKITDDSTNSTIHEDTSSALESVAVVTYSKKLDNGVRIIANQKGFYVQNAENLQFIKIKAYNFQNHIGNIWLKKTYLEGWLEIVHNYNETETHIGNIRSYKNGIIFKENLDCSKKIKLTFK